MASETAANISWRPIILIILMLVVDGLGYCTAQAPMTQLFEDLVCERYYRTNDTPSPSFCKVPAVQSEVANIFGWQAFFDGIPGLVLALWYGALADRRGRRGVLFLSMLGQVLGSVWILLICAMDLPLRLTWMSSMFLIIGGGSTVTRAASMMIVTDATPEASRSKVFFLCQAIFLVAELFGPAIGSLFMESSGVWPPLVIGLLCTVATAALSFIVPETRSWIDSSHSPTRPDAEDAASAAATGSSYGLRESIREIFDSIATTIKFVRRHRNVWMLVLSFLVVDFSRQSLSILVQYASARYSIPISKANFLVSFKALATLVTFAAVLPLLDISSVKLLGWSAKTKDLQLSRFSILLSIVGFGTLIIASSVELVVLGVGVLTLGIGFASFARSLLSSLVDASIIGTVYTTLALMDAMGSILAGPIVAALFHRSMDLTGIWAGLPFISSFVLCILVLMLLSMIRLPPGDPPSQEFGDEERRPLYTDE